LWENLGNGRLDPANKQNRIKCATVAASVAASAVALMESVNLPMKSSQMTSVSQLEIL